MKRQKLLFTIGLLIAGLSSTNAQETHIIHDAEQAILQEQFGK